MSKESSKLEKPKTAGNGPGAFFGPSPFFTARPAVQRQCAECAAEDKAEVQPSLEVGPADDAFERQAESVADQVTGGPASAAEGSAGSVQRALIGAAAPRPRISRGRLDAHAGKGEPLPGTARSFFEPRLGRELGDVRVHANPEAADLSRALGAKAFTYGKDIFFGAGRYAPESPAGKHLLAHELTHTIQQTGRNGPVRRATLDIMDANFVGPLNTNQRRAAASCDISCDGVSIGTLHAMPIFFHSSRGSPLAGSAGANGIGTSLHFIRNGTTPAATNACSSCSTFKIIQVLNSNEPADSRGTQRFVDNNSAPTPFYDDVYASGAGLHTIPTGYPDGGDRVNTTRSIYDRPYRPSANLALVAGQNFFWRAEACVVCVKAGKDKILGGVTYGFTRAWNASTSSHGPVVAEGPACVASPSANFVATLKSDTSTSGYDFET